MSHWGSGFHSSPMNQMNRRIQNDVYTPRQIHIKIHHIPSTTEKENSKHREKWIIAFIIITLCALATVGVLLAIIMTQAWSNSKATTNAVTPNTTVVTTSSTNTITTIVTISSTTNPNIACNHTFTSVIQTALSMSPCAAAAADFNNDGFMDLAISSNNSYHGTVLLGIGNGSFIEQATFVLNTEPQGITAADFNNDGMIDIAVANSGAADMSILLGYGNGTFASQVTYSTGMSPYTITAADFNHDGILDIVVANMFGNSISIFLGHGNGTFASQMTFAIDTNGSPRTYGVAVGDFDGDSNLDVVVANHDSNNVGIVLGYGNGNFSSVLTYTTGVGSGPLGVAVADFNGDNVPDIATSLNGTNSTGILLGYGNGSFAPIVTYSTGCPSSPHTITVSDFNLDFKLDIAVGTLSGGASILLGHGNGTFASVVAYSFLGIPYSIVAADFNQDLKTDLAGALFNTGEMNVILGSC